MKISDLENGLNIRSEVDLELVESIKEQGVLNPLVVFNFEGHWIVKEGHRRLAAAIAAGLEEVNVTVMSTPENPAELIKEQLIINTTQKALSYVDRAQAFAQLVNLGWSQTQIAKTFNVYEPDVSLALKTLRAAPKLREAVNSGKLAPSALESVLPLDLKMQEELADEIIAARTARKVNTLVATEKKKRGIGRGNKPVTESEDNTDPLQLAGMTALEEALASMTVAAEIPLVDPTLRNKGRATVRQLLEVAQRMDVQLA